MLNFAKASMTLGWKLREGQKSGPHWLQFLLSPWVLCWGFILFWAKSDHYGMAECLNHFAYWFKILSAATQKAGLKFANTSFDLLEAHRTEKIPTALRAQISMLMAMGEYEKALEVCEKYLDLQEDPMAHADIQSHKAECLLRLGKVQAASITIDNAIGHLDSASTEEQDFHWAVWKSRALLLKSKCCLALGKMTDAKDFADLASLTAINHNAKVREREIADWQSFLSIRMEKVFA